MTVAEMHPEIWMPVVGWEHSFEVSDLGRVRSLPRTFTRKGGRTYTVAGRLLRLWTSNHGYIGVTLQAHGIRQQKLVHRLVLEAHVGADPENPFANHIDGVRSNNCLSNLEWCTQAENNRKRAQPSVTRRCETGISWSHFTREQAEAIRAEHASEHLSLRALAKKHDVPTATIADIIAGRTYR